MNGLHSKQKLICFVVLAGLLSISIIPFWNTTKGTVLENPDSPNSSIVLAVVGDCNGYNIVKYDEESLDPLASVRTLLNQSDIFLFNLEEALLPAEDLGASTEHPHQSCFVSSPRFAHYMNVESLTVATLANNHILDGGNIGVEKTKKSLEENGIRYLGAGSNATEACKPLILTVKNIKIGFLSYNLVEDPVFSAKEDAPGAASFSSCNVIDSIHRLKENADIVIVVLHWGNSWTQEINTSRIVTADQLADAGADVVIGHHPHMLQAVKVHKNKLIIFSLGNFIFRPDYDMPSNAHNSVIAFINISKGKVRNCYLYPLRIDNHGIPRVPTRKDAETILFNLANLSEIFNTSIKIKGQIGVVDIP